MLQLVFRKSNDSDCLTRNHRDPFFEFGLSLQRRPNRQVGFVARLRIRYSLSGTPPNHFDPTTTRSLPILLAHHFSRSATHSDHSNNPNHRSASALCPYGHVRHFTASNRRIHAVPLRRYYLLEKLLDVVSRRKRHLRSHSCPLGQVSTSILDYSQLSTTSF